MCDEAYICYFFEYLLTLCADAHKKRQALESDIKKSMGMIFSLCDQDQLRIISDSLTNCVNALLRWDEDTPEMIPGSVHDYETSMKWFSYAIKHPECRKMYDECRGKVDWDDIERRK